MPMTPERINELLAKWTFKNLSLDEEIEIMDFVHECAKPEPVYQLQTNNDCWYDVILDVFNHADRQKRIVYTAPQPDERDERIKELEAQRDELKERLEVNDKCKEWDGIATRNTTINRLQEQIKELQEQYADWKDQNEIALDNAERRIKELEVALNKTAAQRDELRQIRRTCSFTRGDTKCDCGFHSMKEMNKP